MQQNDQFLIAVPTRNREGTVLKSLPSLEPIFGMSDVRVVVSDNSDEPSTILRDYCRTKGIDWLRPPSVLSMTAHWNWILESQNYRAITIMTDRTWMIADVWLEAKDIANQTNHAVCWEGGTFTSRTLFGCRLGVLSAPGVTQRHFFIPSTALIELLKTNHIRSFTPRLLNSITFKSEYNSIVTRTGFGLKSISPDYEYAYLHILSNYEGSITFLDKIGLVTHSKFLSNGGAFDTGVSNNANEDFIKLSGLTKFEYAPFPEEYDGVNGVAHELNLALARVGRDPFVDAEMVLRIRRERQKKATRAGPFRYLKTAVFLLGLNPKTILRVLTSDQPAKLGRKINTKPTGAPHILDQVVGQ